MLLNVSALHYVKCDSTFRLRRTYRGTSRTFDVTTSAELSRRPSVLIIEDDALVAEMTAEMVSELGLCANLRTSHRQQVAAGGLQN